MRELDDLLLGYVLRRYDSAPDEEKATFEALLQLSDPELAGYLLKNLEPNAPAIANVIRQILQHDPA